jgi:hypothetical protein
MAYKEPVFTKEAMAALQASWNDNISGRKPTAKAKKKTTAPKKAAAKKPAAKKPAAKKGK